MKKLHLFSVLFLIVCISYGQIDTLQLQDFNGFRVAATELQINNDTVKSINPAPGQVMSFDGQKYINGDETDPKYLTDSSFVKTGVRSWNSSVAKTIDATDTTRWGSTPGLPAVLAADNSAPTQSIIIKSITVDASQLQWGGIDPATAIQSTVLLWPAEVGTTIEDTAEYAANKVNVDWSGGGYYPNVSMYGYKANIGGASNWGAVGRALGFYAKLKTTTPYQTIPKYYGIMLDTMKLAYGDVVWENWGVWSGDPNATNFFSGRVGIGTKRPTGNLEVAGTGTTDDDVVFKFSMGSNDTSHSATDFRVGSPAALWAGIRFSNPSSNVTNMEFSNWNGSARTVRMGIYGTNGNVGINTIKPTETLEVNGNVMGDSIKGFLKNELDPKYAADSSFIKTGIRLVNSNHANWDKYNQWDGESTGLAAATGRTSLGGTTVGQNIFTLSNPSAIRFLRINADNTITPQSAGNFKTDLSLGNVENTALSTWVGSSYITTLGTIVLGIWHGSTIADAYISSSATWNAKLSTCPVATTSVIGGFKMIANTAGYTINASDQLVVDPSKYNTGTPTTSSEIGFNNGGTNYKATIANILALGGMVWPAGAGIAVYSGSSSWGTSLTDNHLNWDKYNQWDGGSTGLTAATGRTSLGLGNVENTALSTWVGSANITTLGTIATGSWHANSISDAYITSAATWNAIALITPQTLTSSGTITMNYSSGRKAALALAHTATLTITNVPDGGEGQIEVTNSSTYTLNINGSTGYTTEQVMGINAAIKSSAHTTVVYWRSGSTLYYGFIFNN